MFACAVWVLNGNQFHYIRSNTQVQLVRVPGSGGLPVKYIFSIPTRIALLLALAIISMVAGAESDVAKFYGKYQGRAISDSQGEVGPRDSTVEIAPHKNGFTINWISVSRKTGGEIKRKNYNIEFHPTRRQSIYKAGMRTNIFGARVPLDPMRGDPYIWARINGPAFTVYALHVLDDGSYEMQIYERTLTVRGLDIKYSRLREGKLLRSVSGSLKNMTPE